MTIPTMNRRGLAQELWAQLVDILVHRDLAALRDITCSDFRLTLPGVDRAPFGVAVNVFRRWSAAFPDIGQRSTGLLTIPAADGTHTTICGVFSFTHLAPLQLPDRTILAATDRHVTIRAEIRLVASRGRISEIRLNFDLDALVRQLQGDILATLHADPKVKVAIHDQQDRANHADDYAVI